MVYVLNFYKNREEEMSIPAIYRNEIMYPLTSNEEIVKEVAAEVGLYYLEQFPDKTQLDEKIVEHLENLKQKKISFGDMFFLAGVIKDGKVAGIKIIPDDLLKIDNYLLVAQRVKIPNRVDGLAISECAWNALREYGEAVIQNKMKN